ncbi:MAG: sensor histidine kinase [Acidobacteria bacterium]|nr:sensor histidine kinase [Acidobacteriota bacterium]
MSSRRQPPWEMYAAAPILLGMVLLVGFVSYDAVEQIVPAFRSLSVVLQRDDSALRGADSWREDKTIREIRRVTLDAAAIGREVLLSDSSTTAEQQRELLRGARAELWRASLEYETLNPLAGSLPQWQQTRNLLTQYGQILDRVLGEDHRTLSDSVNAVLQDLTAKQTAILRQVEKLSDIHRGEILDREARVPELGNAFHVRLFWAVGACLMIASIIIVLPILHAWRVQRRLQAQYQKTLKTKNDLRKLSARLVRVQEEERRSISRELHDEVGQALTAARLDLALLEQKMPADRGDLREFAQEAKTLVEQTMFKLRDLSRLLRPNLLDDEGLAPAVKWLVKSCVRRAGVDVSLETKGLEGRLPAEFEIAAYRMVQEGLTNIIRHASATRAKIRLENQGGALRIKIQDDGSGMAAPPAGNGSSGGLGLLGIRERMEQLGGRLEILTAPGQGVCLMAEVPLSCSESAPFPAKGLSWTASAAQ